jgi:hypothetical protein
LSQRQQAHLCGKFIIKIRAALVAINSLLYPTYPFKPISGCFGIANVASGDYIVAELAELAELEAYK